MELASTDSVVVVCCVMSLLLLASADVVSEREREMISAIIAIPPSISPSHPSAINRGWISLQVVGRRSKLANSLELLFSFSFLLFGVFFRFLFAALLCIVLFSVSSVFCERQKFRRKKFN